VFKIVGRTKAPRRYPRLKQQDVSAASELYMLGHTTEELAGHFGVHVTTIRNALRRNGVNWRSTRTRRAYPSTAV
jgi:transposase